MLVKDLEDWAGSFQGTGQVMRGFERIPKLHTTVYGKLYWVKMTKFQISPEPRNLWECCHGEQLVYGKGQVHLYCLR